MNPWVAPACIRRSPAPGEDRGKGSRKNKFTEFALRFRSYLVDLIE
jgi:hypothetical protein